MPSLKSRYSEHECFLFTLNGIEDKNEVKPWWIRIICFFWGKTYQFSITDSDLADMINGIELFVKGKSDKYYIETTDFNFIFKIRKTDTIKGEILIEIWYGEIVDNMVGIRFYSSIDIISKFCNELKNDYTKLEV